MVSHWRAHATLDDAPRPFNLTAGEKNYAQQFDSVYSARLHQLRPTLIERSKEVWGKRKEKPTHVPRVLDVVKGQLCYIIGTAYIEMPLKANVLDDIAKDQSLAALPVQTKRASETDVVTLEDESGRVALTGDILAGEKLVTGVTLAALGLETSTGDFEVREVIYPGFAPIAPLPNGTPNEVSYCAFMSGISFGEWPTNVGETTTPGKARKPDTGTALSLFLDWISGEGGSDHDRELAQRVSRVIVAGDSLAAPPIEDERDSSKVSGSTITSMRQSVLSLGETLQEVARTVPVHVLPGASDPTGSALPQQPMPVWMFNPQAHRTGAPSSQAIHMESNPTWIHSNGKSILVHAGQPITDIYLHSVETDRMTMVRNTLKWRHIAPTAPDTLWSYPYNDTDPFVLDRSPDVYVIGNQPSFMTEMVGGTRVVLLPQFAGHPMVVLVDTATLGVQTVEFGM
ncbi:hypothetical protein BDV93DRAFT_553821 [Ceratobasidium sp. AG-I]|nr:hypothetical protein BDV93DRAFT_553821 [Ceratobasidium sp. AG-I]